MDVSKLLLTAMKRANVTQENLAYYSGLSQSYISQICLGKKKPTLDTIEKLCKALSMPISDFFFSSSVSPFIDRQTDSETTNVELRDDEADLIFLYRRVSEKDRQLLHDLATNMLTLSYNINPGSSDNKKKKAT